MWIQVWDFGKESTEVKSVGAEEKVEDSNYKDYQKEFLEKYKEHPKEEPKYKQSALEMIQKSNNVFHVSLLDVGFYNTNLKGFFNSKSRENLNAIEKQRKELIMNFGESLDKGGFKKDTSVFINPKNYGQTWPKGSNWYPIIANWIWLDCKDMIWLTILYFISGTWYPVSAGGGAVGEKLWKNINDKKKVNEF